MSDASAPADEISSVDHLPLVVLVHGAWHGAWCWAALQAELDRRGVASLAVDLPGHGASLLALGDLHGDAQHVADVVAHLGRPVVLVGHSYGGAVVSEAAVRIARAGTGPVRHLVYLAAFALDDGESIGSLLGSLPRERVDLAAAMVHHDTGVSTLDPVLAVPALYTTTDPTVARAAAARLGPQPAATFAQALTGPPRAAVASTYVVCTLDRSIAPAHQEAMATRCDTVVSLHTDHSPFVSMVQATADVVVAAATQGEAGRA